VPEAVHFIEMEIELLSFANLVFAVLAEERREREREREKERERERRCVYVCVCGV